MNNYNNINVYRKDFYFHIEINRDYIMIGIKGKYFRIPMSEEVDLTHIILQSVKAMRGI